MVHHWQPSVASLAADAEMNEHYVVLLVANIRATVTWEMRRANALLQIGGVDEDCEADEVSFRSYKVIRAGVHRVVWLRFVGAVRRGSALVYWGELEDREVAAGQGGGGKINAEEVKYHVLERGSEHGYSARPLFHPWSVLHTDMSSEYLKLHRLTGLERYRRLKLWHTFVRHSRKKNAEGVWMPVQFTVRKRITVKSGAVDWRKGGTQKKDGFWASVRKHVSRRGVINKNRELLRQMSYFFSGLTGAAQIQKRMPFASRSPHRRHSSGHAQGTWSFAQEAQACTWGGCHLSRGRWMVLGIAASSV